MPLLGFLGLSLAHDVVTMLYIKLSDKCLKMANHSSIFTASVCSLVAFCIYINTLQAGFAYDDTRAILGNNDLHPDTPWSNLVFNDFWGTPLVHSGSHKSYRPLCVLSFRLNYLCGELNPWGYHLVNILLHSFVTFLFTRIAHTLFTRTVILKGSPQLPALVTGLMFAIHPVHTEAVAGVVGRADVGACLFFLLVLSCYMQYCHTRDTASSGAKTASKNGTVFWEYLLLIMSMLFSVLSMLTKEHGITVLGVCVIYDTFIIHRVPITRLHHVIYRSSYTRLRRGLFALITCTVALVTFRINFNGSRPPDFAPSDNPAADSPDFFTRFLTFSFLPAFNVWLLLCPWGLSFDWSMSAIPLVSELTDIRNLQTALLYAALIFISLRCVLSLQPSEPAARVETRNGCNKKHHPPSQLRNGNSVHSHAHSHSHTTKKTPSSSSSGNHVENEYDLLNKYPSAVAQTSVQCFTPCTITVLALAILILPFLPATNLFFYVGFVVAERILYIPSMGFCLMVGLGVGMIWNRCHKSRVVRVLVAVSYSTLLIAFCVRTVLRNSDWQSEESLYRSGIIMNPAKAWGNLGNILSGNSMKREAELCYRKALEHRGNMGDTHYNLGILLQEMDRLEEAVLSYEMAIKCRPRMTVAHLNYGITLASLGRREEAEFVYRHAANIDGTGMKDPKNHATGIISSLYNLGRLLYEEERYTEAIDSLMEAVNRRPSHYAPHSIYNMLGECYSKLALYIDAEQWFMHSLASKADHVPAHLTYANMLGKQGFLRQAEDMYLKAIQLDTGNGTAYKHYAHYLYEQSKYREAADMFQKAIDSAPLDYELAFNAANAFRQVKSNELAEDLYRKAVGFRPEYSGGYMNLGAMLHINGKLREAEQMYLGALHLKPDDYTTKENLRKLRVLISQSQSNNGGKK